MQRAGGINQSRSVDHGYKMLLNDETVEPIGAAEPNQQVTSAPRSATLRFATKWIPLLGVLMLLQFCSILLCLKLVFGELPSWPKLIAVSMPVLVPFGVILAFAMRMAKAPAAGMPRPGIQFGIPFLLLMTTLAGIWLTCVRLDRHQLLRSIELRKALEQKLKSMLRVDHVNLGPQSVVVVNRTDFNDHDLETLLKELQQPGIAGNYPLYLLDLSNTQVTDQSVRQLFKQPKLQHLFLTNTRVTGDVVAVLSQLGSLMNVSLKGTQLSNAESKALSMALPKAQILAGTKEHGIIYGLK